MWIRALRTVLRMKYSLAELEIKEEAKKVS